LNYISSVRTEEAMSLLGGGGGKATMPPTPTGLGNVFSLHEIH